MCMQQLNVLCFRCLPFGVNMVHWEDQEAEEAESWARQSSGGSDP